MYRQAGRLALNYGFTARLRERGKLGQSEALQRIRTKGEPQRNGQEQLGNILVA